MKILEDKCSKKKSKPKTYKITCEHCDSEL